MKLLIDGDGCPVTDLAISIGKKYLVPVWILCDTAHEIHRPGAVTFVHSKGADSVDFALVNKVDPGDVVLTQDYGLAAMCLARKAVVLNQNGKHYTPENIDGLLSLRHASKKARLSGHRTKGPQKRTRENDREFREALDGILRRILLENPDK